MKICVGERFGKEAVNGITVYPMQVSAVETAALRWMRTMAAATEYEQSIFFPCIEKVIYNEWR